jgi:antitoxin component YwqK of YwqJK toxin-antitoxin module
MIAGSIIAQYDTIFLDEKFKPIEKGNHSYYRLIDTLEHQQYKIRDFYRNDSLQMIGIADAPDEKHLTGIVKRYNQDGSILSICKHHTYTEGWISFYSKNSIKTVTLYCRNEIKNGKAIFFDDKGKVIGRGIYKNDRPYSGYMPAQMALSSPNYYNFHTYKKGKQTNLYKYYANGKRAMTGYTPETYLLAEATYYDNNGKKNWEPVFIKIKPHTRVFTSNIMIRPIFLLTQRV